MMTRNMTTLVLLTICLFARITAEDSSEDYSYEEYIDGFVEENRPKTEENEVKTLSVCVNDKGQLFTTEVQCEHRVAWGRFENKANHTGWSFLEVETSDKFDPEIQAYAAGVVEGKLSRLLIYYHLKNTIEGYCTGHKTFCEKLYDYLHKNVEWIRGQLIANPGDEYWKHVNLTLTQLTGINDGYENKILHPQVSFDISPIYMVQLSGELIDLEKAFGKKKPPNTPPAGKCSGYVGVAPNTQNLFYAQVAMSGLQTMTRVLKLYKFGYDKKQVPGHTAAFSGYPGAIASADDFVLLSSGLAAVETTTAVYNNTLYSSEFIRPTNALHCWLRSIVSNNMASTGRQWSKIFSRYNSGTYNNQWTVLDFKKFKKGQPLPTKDLVWVLEQMPGLIMARDVTWFVRKYGYWASYNIPFFKKMYKYSGFENEKKKLGNWISFEMSPRAQIFRRDHHKVVDIESLTKLMRYNNYKHDPLSRCQCNPPYTAEAAISARGDLNPVNGTFENPSQGHRNHASLDMKGTDLNMFSKLGMRAWGGPTYDPLPPFSWATTNIVAKHFGMPITWNFQPVDHVWQTPVRVRMH